MARELKRKRGRPSKADAEAARKPVVQDDSGQAKRRGRPRKSGEDLPPKPIKPMKATKATKAAKAVVASVETPKKGRGRPKKVDAVETPAAPAAPETQSKRGRPRKSDVAPVKPKPVAPPAKVNDDGTPKRGRGRPPKKTRVTKTAAAEETAPKYMKPPATLERGRSKVFDQQATPDVTNGDATDATDVPEPQTQTQEVDPIAKMIIGSYEIKCPTAEGEWPDMAENLAMSIVETEDTRGTGFLASFHLGILEGTMILAPTVKALDKLYSKLSNDEPFGNSKDEDEDESPSSKRQKMSASGKETHRLHLYWRGSETVESQIHSGRNKGHMEFSEENSVVRFYGVSGFPAMGSECRFSGIKVDDVASRQPEPWLSFSQSAADEKNIARWG